MKRIIIEKVGDVIELDGIKYKSLEYIYANDKCRGCAFDKTLIDGSRVCSAENKVKCLYSFGSVIYKKVVVDIPGNKPLTEQDVKDLVALMNERDFAKHSIKLLRGFRTASKVTISTEVYTEMIELTCETKNAFIDNGVRIMEERIAELNLKIKSYGITE